MPGSGSGSGSSFGYSQLRQAHERIEKERQERNTAVRETQRQREVSDRQPARSEARPVVDAAASISAAQSSSEASTENPSARRAVATPDGAALPATLPHGQTPEHDQWRRANTVRFERSQASAQAQASDAKAQTSATPARPETSAAQGIAYPDGPAPNETAAHFAWRRLTSSRIARDEARRQSVSSNKEAEASSKEPERET